MKKLQIDLQTDQNKHFIKKFLCDTSTIQNNHLFFYWFFTPFLNFQNHFLSSPNTSCIPLYPGDTTSKCWHIPAVSRNMCSEFFKKNYDFVLNFEWIFTKIKEKKRKNDTKKQKICLFLYLFDMFLLCLCTCLYFLSNENWFFYFFTKFFVFFFFFLIFSHVKKKFKKSINL